MKPKAIVDPHFRRMDEIFAPDDLARLHDQVEVLWGRSQPMPEADFLAALPNADIVICSSWRYGDVLDRAERLRAIITVSGAFPLELDYDQCYERRIRVLSVAPAFAPQVAEFCLGLAIASARDIAYGDRLMRRGEELYLHEGNEGTFTLFNQPVGIIGYGGIARVLHRLLQPFNPKLYAYDAWLGDGYLRRCGVEPLPLADLLSRCRLIFALATPSTENEALLSRALLERIQPGSVLVLGSRAHIMDFDAATELTRQGHFKLATDVFPQEPLPPDHPIRQAESALLSAHRAGTVRDAMFELGQMVVDDVEAIARGLPPRRLQRAEPELSQRYATNRAKSGK